MSAGKNKDREQESETAIDPKRPFIRKSRHMIQKIAKRFSPRRQASGQSSDHGGSKWDLYSLTPKFIEREHREYVRAISDALADKRIWNIAVSGNHGVGKSSILRKVAHEHKSKVVELSLSTLSPIDTSPEEFESEHTTTITNRIQQEIVKQLLYQEKPRKMPGSRFHRIERFSWTREALKASLISFALPILFALSGWSEQLKSMFPFLEQLGVWLHPFIWLISTVFVLFTSRLFYGQIHVSRLSAGAAAVTLEDKSVSYFDQYLDEIVYFFEVSKRRVVVFEDIDRFDDSRIFETLRTLNTLLNTSPQVNGTVHFIYAIKDSIFDQNWSEAGGRNIAPSDDPVESEAVRANRTKFFDLVIPVVPFITHQNARNLAVQLLSNIEHNIDRELIDLATQYVPDMRLLKNACNEFIIFRYHIFSGDGTKIRLNDNDLFAMMLYKSTHLTDFENIRIGQSELDYLYSVSRNLVQKNAESIEDKIIQKKNQRDSIDQLSNRHEEMGNRLNDHIEYILRVINSSKSPSHEGDYYIGKGQDREAKDVTTLEFWQSLLSSKESYALTYKSGQYRGEILSFTLSDLEKYVGIPTNAEILDREDRERLDQKILKLEQDLDFIRAADFKDLIERSDFLLENEDNESSGESESFESISRRRLCSKLAYHLMKFGYINRNFTLYTSTFHGTCIGPAAMNFLIHHVECNSMDEHFQLAPEDVEAVIKERGKNSLKEPAFYNINLLDDRLQNDSAGADIIIKALAEFGDKQTRFIRSYMRGGYKRTQFVERFTAQCPNIFVFLVDQIDLDEKLRSELVDIALQSLSEKIDYQINDSVRDYVLKNYEDLPCLTSTDSPPKAPERIANWFSQASLRIPCLARLSSRVCQSFVEQNLYEIGQDNLQIAIDRKDSLALDVIHSREPQVYDYVLDHLGQYLEAVESVSPTVHSKERFIPVIEKVLERDSVRLNAVVERASSECTIQDLADVSTGAWSVLANYGRFPATFDNVRRYLEQFKIVDTGLAGILSSAKSVSETEGADPEAKRQVARAILSAHEALPFANLRVDLVVSLTLSTALGLNDVEPETGELFAQLVKNGLLVDDVPTYKNLADTDWKARESLICQSRNFLHYMTADIVQGDIGNILESKRIGRPIKDNIAEQAGDYMAQTDPEELTSLAKYADQEGKKLEIGIVEKMAHNGVEPSLVIALLVPHLISLNYNDLFEILKSLGGAYRQLVSADQKGPKINKTWANERLLEYLKRNSVVSSVKRKDSLIEVYKSKS